MKESIPQLAKRLVEETLIISKPIHYPSMGKELEQKINKFWVLNGKAIVKENLIKSYSEMNEMILLEAHLNPSIAHTIQSTINYTKDLINEIKKL